MKKPATEKTPPLPKAVLIVEDSTTQAAVLKNVLEKHGWRVRVANDGVAALEQFRLSKPDIVVSDIRMPRMDGYALSKAIKTDPDLCDVPVVLFTSLSQPHDIIDAINSRADYYFLKQWDHNLLIAKIAAVLDTYQPSSGTGRDGLTVRMDGQTYTIEANAQQPLSLLLSTYEIAVQQSLALAAARDQLREANESLEEAVRDRTAQFIASETRYRRLFEAAKDGILILDAETGMIVDMNPFLAELLGFSHEQSLGKTIWDLGFLKDIIANRDNFLELQRKGYVRYENLPLEREDGRPLAVEVVSNVYMAGDKKVIQCNIRDITERTAREKQQKLSMQVLATLNRGNDVALLVKDILRLIKESTGFEAVGIRLREGDDFPYYETNGFPRTFIEAGRHLCVRDAAGDLVRDATGNPVLECMCGNVLCRRFDPTQPFFTSHGSFWTNSTTNLIASTTEQDRLSRMRSCCNEEGYESVALIPLRSGDEVIGLLQLNDHRKGLLSLGMIEFFEGMGSGIGIAVKRRRHVEAVRRAKDFSDGLIETAQAIVLVLDSQGRIVQFNPYLEEMSGYRLDEVLGKDWCDIFVPDRFREATRKLFQAASHGIQTRGNVTPIVTKEGREHQIEWYDKTLKEADGSVVGLLSIGHDITGRLRAEEAVRESEARYRTLFDDARDGIAVAETATGKLVDCNRALCRMVDRDKADLVGQPQSVLHPPPDLVDGLSPTFLEHRRDLTGSAGEDRLMAKSGKAIPVEVTGTHIRMNGRDYLMGAFRDITDRKRVEAEQRRLFAAIEQASEIVVITDAAALIQYTNPAFTRVTGYTSEEVRGKNPRVIQSGKHDAAFYRQMWDTLTAGQTWRGRFINKRKDGTLYTEEAAISPVHDATGTVVNYVAVKRDITHELSLEAQLLQAQKLESIGTLAGGVAHEINNPIMGIMSYAQLILDKLGPESPVAEFATEIGRETARVATIVKNLLSFARQERETHSPARMCDIVEATLSLVHAVMRHDQIALDVDVPEDLPKLKCRSQQIQQVLMNLLTNARDALNDKYPGYDENKTVTITARIVEHGTGDGQQRLRLTVEDHGTGIPDAVRERMFDPFYTTKKPDKGTGLGLSISHGIVKEHRGELSVESEVGQWTRFHVDLPVDNGWEMEGGTQGER